MDTTYSNLSDCLQHLQLAADTHDIRCLQCTFTYLKAIDPFSWVELRQLIAFVVERNPNPQEFIWLQRLAGTIRFLTLDFHAYLTRRYNTVLVSSLVFRLTQFIERLLSSKRWMETVNSFDIRPSSLIYELMLLRSDLIDYGEALSDPFSSNTIHKVYQQCYSLIHRPHIDLLKLLLYQLDQLRQQQPLTNQDPFGIYIAIDILATTMKNLINVDFQQALWNGFEGNSLDFPQQQLPGLRQYFHYALQIYRQTTSITTPLYKWFEEAVLLSLSNRLSKTVILALVAQIQQNSKIVSDQKCIQQLVQPLQLFSTVSSKHQKIISLPHCMPNMLVRQSFLDKINDILLNKHRICNIIPLNEIRRGETDVNLMLTRIPQFSYNLKHQESLDCSTNRVQSISSQDGKQVYKKSNENPRIEDFLSSKNHSFIKMIQAQAIISKAGDWVKSNGHTQSIKADLNGYSIAEETVSKPRPKDFINNPWIKEYQICYIGEDKDSVMPDENPIAHNQFRLSDPGSDHGLDTENATNHSRQYDNGNQEKTDSNMNSNDKCDSNLDWKQVRNCMNGSSRVKNVPIKDQIMRDRCQGKWDTEMPVHNNQFSKNCINNNCENHAIPNCYGNTCGLGKTTLAIHYATLYQKHFDIIYYLRADSVSSLKQDFIRLGSLLINKFRHRKNDQVRNLVRACSSYHNSLTMNGRHQEKFLELNHYYHDINQLIERIIKLLLDPITGKVLLIYDDVTDSKWIQKYLPRRYHCYLIVISSEPFNKCVPVKVHPFDRESSVQFLCQGLHQHDKESANDLAAMLKDLPLALSLAKATIYQQGISLSCYIRKCNLIKHEIKQFINDTSSLSTYLKGFLSQTLHSDLIIPWYLNIRLAIEKIPKAETMLNIMAYLDPNKIEICFIQDLFDRYNCNSDQIYTVLRRLHSFRLIDRINEQNYTINPYLQIIIRYMAGTKGKDLSLLDCIISYFMDRLRLDCFDKDNWEISRWAINHLEVACEHSKYHASLRPLLMHASGWLSYSYCMFGMYNEAKIYAKHWLKAYEAVESYQKVNDSNHCFSFISSSESYHRQKDTQLHSYCSHSMIKHEVMHALLGKIYFHLGKNGKSLISYQKSLAIRLGKSHPNRLSIASTYQTLGRILCHLGQITEALNYLQKSLTIRITYLGHNHIEVASTYDIISLANYIAGDRSNEAVKSLNKSLNVKNKIYHEHSLDLAKGYTALGQQNFNSGQFQSAIAYYQNALEIMSHKLGENHIRVGQTSFQLGQVHYVVKDFNTALQYYQYALQIFKTHFGYSDTKTASAYYCLGLVSYAQDQFTTALDYFKQSIGIELEKYGSNSLRVAKICHYMSELLCNLGEQEEAQKFYDVTLTWNDPNMYPFHR